MKKTLNTVFIVGLLAISVLSIIGLVYLSQMAFDKKSTCGNLNKTEKNIAKLTIIALWIQFAWIILGSILQPIWQK